MAKIGGVSGEDGGLRPEPARKTSWGNPHMRDLQRQKGKKPKEETPISETIAQIPTKEQAEELLPLLNAVMELPHKKDKLTPLQEGLSKIVAGEPEKLTPLQLINVRDPESAVNVAFSKPKVKTAKPYPHTLPPQAQSFLNKVHAIFPITRSSSIG